MPVYVEALSDDCTCRWVNYSDHGGWYLRSLNPRCPLHGHDDAEAGQ